MKLINIMYTKISGQRDSNDLSDLKIETMLDIVKIKEIISENSKDGFLSIEFKFGINYEPKIAKIELSGKMTISSNKEEIKKILNEWEEKKLSDSYKLIIFNGILSKANIKAIQLEDNLNLPTHFKLPSLKVNNKQ